MYQGGCFVFVSHVLVFHRVLLLLLLLLSLLFLLLLLYFEVEVERLFVLLKDHSGVLILLHLSLHFQLPLPSHHQNHHQVFQLVMKSNVVVFDLMILGDEMLDLIMMIVEGISYRAE